jgi:large subunit ribosomal protein L35
MPKLKTHKGLKKRIRVTKNGKIKRPRAGRRHLLSGKSGKSRRQSRRPAFIQGKKAESYITALSGEKV